MIRSLRLALLAAGFVAAASPDASAQPLSFGVEAGLGAGVASRPGVGYSVRAAAFAERGPWALTARQAVASGGSNGFEGAFRGTVQRDVYLDQALLVGRVVERGATRLTASAGPAVVYFDLTGTVPDGCESPDCRPGDRRSSGPFVGLALEGVARRPLAGALEGHLGAFATLGTEQPSGGLTAGLTLVRRR